MIIQVKINDYIELEILSSDTENGFSYDRTIFKSIKRLKLVDEDTDNLWIRIWFYRGIIND